MRLGLARKNREVLPKTWEHLYEQKIIEKIRVRYSVNQELAILRQRYTKPDEFEEYNIYVEQCKALVKDELGIEADE